MALEDVVPWSKDTKYFLGLLATDFVAIKSTPNPNTSSTITGKYMKEMICICCPMGCHLQVDDSDRDNIIGDKPFILKYPAYTHLELQVVNACALR